MTSCPARLCDPYTAVRPEHAAFVAWSTEKHNFHLETPRRSYGACQYRRRRHNITPLTPQFSKLKYPKSMESASPEKGGYGKISSRGQPVRTHVARIIMLVAGYRALKIGPEPEEGCYLVQVRQPLLWVRLSIWAVQYLDCSAPQSHQVHPSSSAVESL